MAPLGRVALAAALAACAPARTIAQAPAADPWHVRSAPPAGYDRARGQRETRAHLEALVRLDTRNPPGNEARTARYFDSVFARMSGVERHVLDVGGGRANFVARLRATRPTGRPVLVMGHMDVVGVDTAKWTTDPLAATERDGYLYGRGTIDDKGMLAATVAALGQLAERRHRLTRDVIFLGTAAEEGGDVGIDWVIANRFDLVREAEFALNEGGRIRVQDRRVRTVNVQTTEKVSYNVRVRATGPSGHGSVPVRNNALVALARSVARVDAWRSPVKLNETTRLYFARLATIEPDPAMRAAMERLSATGATAEAIDSAAAILGREPLHEAVLRSAASLTLIDGGIRTNVIPSEGTANFNLRVLPNDDVQAVVRAMNAASGEPAVTYELDGAPASAPPPSPVTSDLFRAMERAALSMAPEAVVIPFMSTGATDGAALRARGIPTYGILPFPLPMEDEMRMHGDDERVPIAALGWAAEYLYRVLAGVAER